MLLYGELALRPLSGWTWLEARLLLHYRMLTYWLARGGSGSGMSGLLLRTARPRHHRLSARHPSLPPLSAPTSRRSLTSHSSDSASCHSSILDSAHCGCSIRRYLSPLSLPSTQRRCFTTASSSATDAASNSAKPLHSASNRTTHDTQESDNGHRTASTEQTNSSGKADSAGTGAGNSGSESASGTASGASSDGDDGSSSPSVAPPSGRHALLGGVVVLSVLGGVLWVVYDRGWVSDYMASSLLSDLAANGPSTVVDLNGPGDKWQLIHVNATLRRKCAEPQYIERLMEGIKPTEHIVEVQRMCLVILSELAHDRQTGHHHTAHTAHLSDTAGSCY